MNVREVTRFSTANGLVHEVDTDRGAIVAWRHERTEPDVPVLEFSIPRHVDEAEARLLPFLEDPALNSSVLVSFGGSDAAVSPLFPLGMGALRVPAAIFPRLAMLWIIEDGPFGRFAWRHVIVEGVPLCNDTVDAGTVSGSDWDLVVEVDYDDCVRCFLGDLEIRDMIVRGHVVSSLATLSAWSWLVERDEIASRAAPERPGIERLLRWVEIARSDEVLEWVARLRQGRSEARPRVIGWA
jgi:hypothetical protein